MPEYIVTVQEESRNIDEMFIGAIRSYPKLIRCRNCRYWWKEDELCKHPKTCDGSICCLECGPDFYCGYAEREEE